MHRFSQKKRIKQENKALLTKKLFETMKKMLVIAVVAFVAMSCGGKKSCDKKCCQDTCSQDTVEVVEAVEAAEVVAE